MGSVPNKQQRLRGLLLLPDSVLRPVVLRLYGGRQSWNSRGPRKLPSSQQRDIRTVLTKQLVQAVTQWSEWHSARDAKAAKKWAVGQLVALALAPAASQYIKHTVFSLQMRSQPTTHTRTYSYFLEPLGSGGAAWAGLGRQRETVRKIGPISPPSPSLQQQPRHKEETLLLPNSRLAGSNSSTYALAQQYNGKRSRPRKKRRRRSRIR